MSYIKVFFNNKHHRYYRYVQTERVHRNLKTNIARCTNFVQSAFYSTNPQLKDENKDSSTKVDPRVEALKDKLLYSDYLHSEQVRMGHLNYMKKQLNERITKKIEREKKLTCEPAPSIIARNLFNDEKYDENKDAELSEPNIEEENVQESRNRDIPVHMPLANVDKYTLVKQDDESDLHVLNKDIKKLYEQYLELKAKYPEEMKNLKFKTFVDDEYSDEESENEETFNIPRRWMADYEYCDDPLIDYSSEGTANPDIDVSSVPCGGCGALLHCKDKAIPGYIPSELFVHRTNDDLKAMICQRCHFLKSYNTALKVKVSPDEYADLLKVIKTKKCAVVLMVDLTDFPCSIWPDINTVLHPLTPVFIVGNKVDLLPMDSKEFFDHVKKCLREHVEATGIRKERIRDVSLISAKTGFGIEELINKLQFLWRFKGDVYVVGCTNVGKSTLFNALLQSDYCKVQAADVVQRATISPWPGTTLNLLKFPMLRPSNERVSARLQRLKAENAAKRVKEEERKELFKATGNMEYVTLQSDVGRTFYRENVVERSPFTEKSYRYITGKIGLNENSEIYRASNWCYDTPGTIQPDQVLDLLTTEELVLTLPKCTIHPRTFIMKPNQTMFLAGLGRLDYLSGNNFIRCTVFSSDRLPVTMCHTVDAEEVYNELLQTPALVVPVNNSKRLKVWPSLGSKELEVLGINQNESAADVVLSSGGWIAIAPDTEDRVVLRAWTPEGRGIHLRTPALLRKSVSLRGVRISHLPAYRKGRMVYVR